MIRYTYNRQVAPAAPFVYVNLRCVETGKEASNQPAQLDTGGDRTVLPGSIVEHLGLIPLDEIPIGGFGGHVTLTRTYRVELGIHQLSPWIIEAIAHADEPFILLGRDVLNQLRLLLDGPQFFLEIG
jgi:predicted aspartyl protease